MAISIQHSAPTLLIRKSAYERAGFERHQFDETLNLTPDEFRVLGEIVAIGPIVGETALTELIDVLESAGLTYFEDFFEMSGNWPEWLQVFAQGN